MDRRTWMQLLAVLSTARAGAQDRPAAAPAGGQQRPPQRPLRVTKEQVAAAFVLLGLEFQDAELDMMLRRVNDALGQYEGLRKVVTSPMTPNRHSPSIRGWRGASP